MAIFNSYVSLPEGKIITIHWPEMLGGMISLKKSQSMAIPLPELMVEV